MLRFSYSEITHKLVRGESEILGLYMHTCFTDEVDYFESFYEAWQKASAKDFETGYVSL